ncbi:MAG: hypothetical protein OEU36_25595 [Gammaproteobacteria bacterium]|nr:hypothetical protein [Gammaproteobacteria bacterium]
MKILAIVILAIVLTLVITVGSLRTDWVFYPETGMQEYERSFLGLVIEPMSERNYKECKNIKLGEKAVGKSKVLISSCYLVFGCVVSENPSDVFECAT